ncbi:hypothetical protein [Roseibacillus ishigakijimensis]|uniref:Uncharacterized protein n=1 Tax=Roseibacillus ishigakijimensis TaxID=454146 RepID=A0A934VJJ5_9BACT|nr:hypothetical protein [Roseibacillus ishigakijimensis]MBK1832669.1 hypothetical protein [Roseibacillus ishigakijimensis]
MRKSSRSSVPVPTTAPTLELDTGTSFQQTIHFRDKGAKSKAKPKGVRGCEIWVAVGAHPQGPGDCRYVGTDTRTPHITHFDPADAGKTAYYYARWVNSRNEPGPWSELTEGTIAG